MNPRVAELIRRRLTEPDLAGRAVQLTDRTDVPRLLCGCDVLVWPAPADGLPHAVAEAGAAGLAVIAVDAGFGGPDLIDDGLTGLLVPAEEPGAPAEAILRLARDAGLRRALGTGLRRQVAARCDLAAVIPQWEALFEELAVPPTTPHTVPAGAM